MSSIYIDFGEDFMPSPLYVAATALVIGLLYTPPAHAYLDAGSISLLLQAIVGTIAGGTVALGLYWRKVKAVISGKRGEPSDATSAASGQSTLRDQ
jgi:hypothetical protein